MIRLAALALGFLLDLLLGDPPRLPHPVVAIGKTIGGTERVLRKVFPPSPRGEAAGGFILVFLIAGSTFALVFFLARLVGSLGPEARFLFDAVVCYQVLATKCLRDAGLAVWRELREGDRADARRAVGRIVGRDTAALDESEIARAAVETVAENTSDGVVAPMFYFAVGGPALAMLYKAINTMDSMVGYKNARYIHFGRAAARLDDAANWLPARITALLMIAAAFGAGLDWRGALRIYRRDRRNHTSPNAGHPEAVCAGALGIRLGGEAHYGGMVVTKPTIGDRGRTIEAEDICRATRLLAWSAVLSFVLCCGMAFLSWRISSMEAIWN